MPNCKYCQTPITWTKEGGRNVPYNADGSIHKCKDGKLIQTPVPTNNIPRITGRVERYDIGSATFTLIGGEKKVYALSSDRYQEFRKAAILLPADSHPDAWVEFQVDKQGFVLPGVKVVQSPDWAKEINDPTKGEVKAPFKSGSQILQENLDAKRAETAANAPGAPAPTNPPPEPEKPAETAPVAPQTAPGAPEPAPMSDEDRIRQAVSAMMPSDRIGCRITLLGCVNSATEIMKLSEDAPKTRAGLEAAIREEAIRLFLWIDDLTTRNMGGK